MPESRKVTIRLKPAEFAIIEREAERRNWSLSEVVRHLMLQKLDLVPDMSDILVRLDAIERRLGQVESQEGPQEKGLSPEEDPFAKLCSFEVGDLCKNLVRNEAALAVKKERSRGLREFDAPHFAKAQLPNLVRRGLSRRNLSILAQLLTDGSSEDHPRISTLCSEVADLIDALPLEELRARYPEAGRLIPANFPPSVLVRPHKTKQVFERDPRWSPALDHWFEDPRA